MRRITIALSVAALVVTFAGPARADDPPPGRFAQTISMAHIPDTTVDQAVTPDADATSLLPVTFTAAGTCTVQPLAGGVSVVATSAGGCTVTAHQPGDDLWLPAEDVSQSFRFVGGDAGVTIGLTGPSNLIAAQGLALSIPVTVTADADGGRTPTGSVTALLVPAGTTPSCSACATVAEPLGPSGEATIRIPGAITAGMSAGQYLVNIQYGGDEWYGPGRRVVPSVAIVPAGTTFGGQEPMVVSLGDSYISGEAGRWAGNTYSSDQSWRIDTNPAAYFDQGGMTESITGCHRSQSAEIHFEQAGAEVLSVNLACSGGETVTHFDKDAFKPGIDYYQNEGAGQRGQALELYRLASANPGRIAMVVLSIGGNDFQFGPIVKTCVMQYLFSISRTRCSSMPSVRDAFTADQIAFQQAAISLAMRNIGDAMTEAGYTPDQWTLVAQDYPSPVPGDAKLIRYGQGLGSGRQTTGGCGLFDADLAFANGTVLKTINATVQRAVKDSGLPNATFLDLTDAYRGNRLCETGVDLVGPLNDVERWTDDNAVLGSEWVAPIRIEAFANKYGPFQLQESMHPNFWGQLANQVCLKLVWNDGKVQGGKCVRADGAYDAAGGTHRTYPAMALLTDG